MTEKCYGGNDGLHRDKGMVLRKQSQTYLENSKKKIKKDVKINQDMDTEKIILAGQIAKDVKEYIKSFIKKDMPLLEIATKIEDKIEELGGKPSFPTNLSINEIAAHYTPSPTDETLAHGLLKIDFGINIDGYLSDTAISFDLENSEVNTKLIEASKEALENTIKILNKETTLTEIGESIERTIEEKGFNPIVNLSGHGMERYNLHSSPTIPNYKNNSSEKIDLGLRAIEPFATTGVGKVHDGKPSEIYMLISDRNIRSPIAREVLKFIIEEYRELPFCSRWIHKKFGTKGILGLRQLLGNGNLHNFPELVEQSKGIVSQRENTILIEEDKITITTE